MTAQRDSADLIERPPPRPRSTVYEKGETESFYNENAAVGQDSLVMDRKTVADVGTDMIAATPVVAGAGVAVVLCFALLTALVAISSPGNPVAIAFGWVLYAGMDVLIGRGGYPFWAPLRSAPPSGGRSVSDEDGAMRRRDTRRSHERGAGLARAGATIRRTCRAPTFETCRLRPDLTLDMLGDCVAGPRAVAVALEARTAGRPLAQPGQQGRAERHAGPPIPIL